MDSFKRAGIAAIASCFLLAAAAASAQTKPGQAGPLVLQPINQGPVLAPEVKFGWFDGKYGTLVGGYGGWQLDNGLLLGAGADFLVDHGYHDPVSGMGYGGFVGGWMLPANRVLSGGVRALVGFGEASFTSSYSYTVPVFPDHHDGDNFMQPPMSGGSTVVRQGHFWDGFFIFEPQASAVVRFTRLFAIDVAGGYRVISGTGSYNSRLQGPSATVAVRFGPGI